MSQQVSLVATLIANPAKASLASALGIKASAAVNATGLYWLADNIACDIALPSGISSDEAETLLRHSLDGAPVDGGGAGTGAPTQENSDCRHGFHDDPAGVHR